MRDKNGFIATSVLYAFLVALLTLFLGFMAEYIQNRQLVARIEEMAIEELNKYGKTQLSDLKVGDHVVFDTIDDEGDGLTNSTIFSSPIDPSTKWILFDIKEATVETDDDVYYFVSAADAQKFTWLTTAVNNGEPAEIDYIERQTYFGNLATVSQIINGNVFYDNNAKVYRAYDATHTNNSYNNFKKVFTYQFSYSLNDGIDVRFMNTDDFETIESLDEKIKEAIFADKRSFTIWNPAGSANLSNEGFYLINYQAFSKEGEADGICGSTIGYSHTYTNGNRSYVDYCYYPGASLGKCYGSSIKSECNSKTYNYSPRYVASLKVNKRSGTAVKNGFIDSGNGTSQFPYLITKGAK